MHEAPSIESSSSGSISTGLLQQVKVQDGEAWDRLVHLFGPLVYDWAAAYGLQDSDAVDVVQNVFTAVLTRIDGFRRDRQADTFRGWLWTTTHFQVRELFRARQSQPIGDGGTSVMLRWQQLEARPPQDAAQVRREMNAVLLRGVEFVRHCFEEISWQAFWFTAVEGQVPSNVAKDLGISVASVYQAKSRVLRRLREELAGLVNIDEMLK